MAKAMSSMNKAELYAEVKRLRGQDTGKDTGKGTSAPKWTPAKNAAGVLCKSKFTFDISEKAIVAHLTRKCGCGTLKGGAGRCRAVKWENSVFTSANHGLGVDKAREAGLIS